MELRHLRYFIAVADAGNFTRAATALGIAQPPLSQQIRALEEEIGARLFHRVPHGAELTAAGSAFLPEAREALAAADRAATALGIAQPPLSQQIRALEEEIGARLFHRVPHGAELTAAGSAFLPEAREALAAADRAATAARRAHRGESGQLRLGFTTSSTYNPLISATIEAFHHRWPGVAVGLEELTTTVLLERVLRGEKDAAFVRPGADPLDPGLATTALPDEPTVIALPANHPLAARESLRLSDLAGEAMILFPRSVGPGLRDEIFAACAASGFTPVLGQEAQRTADTINLVAAHLGVSVVPQSLTQVRLAGVAYRPIEGPAPVARLALVVAKTNRSPILRNFTSLLAGAG